MNAYISFYYLLLFIIMWIRVLTDNGRLKNIINKLFALKTLNSKLIFFLFDGLFGKILDTVWSTPFLKKIWDTPLR